MTDDDTWTKQVDAYVADQNALIGQAAPAPLFPDGPLAFPLMRTHITEDLLRTCARAAGDPNPLWSDDAYGAGSVWGTTIGPPVLEACLAESSSMPSPPPISGWHPMQGGGQRRYYEPFMPGDVIRAEDTWLGFEEKTKPGRPYRLFIEKCERRYINQSDRVVASLLGRVAVTASPPDASDVPRGPDFSRRRRRRYSTEELAAVRDDYRAELSGAARRGAQPRWWEDVAVGDTITGGLKGPYDISDAVAFAGALGLCSAFASKWPEMEPIIDIAPHDPDTGAPHHMIDWHFDDRFAQMRGVPYAPAFGTQLEMMLLHAVTNWMGDDGFITFVDIQIATMLMTGEISRSTGIVTGKRRDADRHVVDLEMTSSTLDNLSYAKGRVTVDLPSHDGYSPANHAARTPAV